MREERSTQDPRTEVPRSPDRHSVPAARAASLRLRGGFVRGLANDELVARVQFSAGHCSKCEIGHAESYLDRLESLVGVQLPHNATVLAQAVRYAPAPAVLAATRAHIAAALLRPA